MKTHGANQMAWRTPQRGAAWVRWLLILALLSATALGFIAAQQGKSAYFPLIMVLGLLWLWMLVGALFALFVGLRNRGSRGLLWGGAALLGALLSGGTISLVISIAESSAPLLSLPHAVQAAMSAVGLTLFVVGIRQVQRKRDPGRCLSCNYDLHGTKLAGLSRCPECGAPITRSAT
jgi:predicted RNA-binding Zn-ribbon protein involved in translation (DUF1610 family)